MPNKTKRGVEYLQTHFPSTFCNIIGSNEKMKVCTGLQNTLLQENEVLLHTSSKKPIAAVNSKYNRIFSFDCEIAFKYNKKLYYCKSCKGLEYHLNELKKVEEDNEEPKEKPKLITVLEECMKNNKLAEDSACYKFLTGVFEAIASAKKPCGFRYDPFVTYIFVILFQIGKQKLFRFLRGSGWNKDCCFTGIFPVPTVASIQNWKRNSDVKPGFSCFTFDNIISQFEDVCKDGKLYIGMTLDEMHINKGLVLDRSGKIIGFPQYKSKEMVDNLESIFFVHPDDKEIQRLLLNDNTMLDIDEYITPSTYSNNNNDIEYIDYMKKNLGKNNENIPADEIVVFFLVLHNGKGKKLRKFCGYFPITKLGHTGAVNGALILQAFLCLSRTINKKLNIRFCSITLDGDSSHRTLFKKDGIFKVDESKGSFYCPFIQQQCYYFQDPEHLVKRIRNNLYGSIDTGDFLLLNGKVVSWQMLILLVQEDQGKPMRNILLSQSDLILTPKTKMTTSKVTKVLRPNVREGLQRKFGDDSESLVEVLKIMDDFLFVFRHWMPFNLDNDSRIDTIKHVQEFFRKWREEEQTQLKSNLSIGHKTKLLPGIYKDIDITITSLINLYEEAKSYKITIIPRTISQNPVENIFCLIRQFCGGIHNPSIREVIGALTGIVATKNLTINSKSSSYQVNNTDWFGDADLETYSKRNSILDKIPSKNKKIFLSENTNLKIEDFKPALDRIASSVLHKKKFEMKVQQSDPILQRIIFWMLSVLKPNIIQEDLPGVLCYKAKEKFGSMFLENLENSGKYVKNVLLDKVLNHLSTITIYEYLSNCKLGLTRGNSPFRDKLNTGPCRPEIIDNIQSFTPEAVVSYIQEKFPERNKNSIAFEYYDPVSQSFNNSAVTTPLFTSKYNPKTPLIFESYTPSPISFDLSPQLPSKRKRSEKNNRITKKQKIGFATACEIVLNNCLLDQEFYNDFTAAAWLTMLDSQDLPPFSQPESNCLLKHNINNLLDVQRVSKLKLQVLVQTIEENDKNYTLTLKDPTGTITAYVPKDILNTSNIEEGSVLTLSRDKWLNIKKEPVTSFTLKKDDISSVISPTTGFPKRYATEDIPIRISTKNNFQEHLKIYKDFWGEKKKNFF